MLDCVKYTLISSENDDDDNVWPTVRMGVLSSIIEHIVELLAK